MGGSDLLGEFERLVLLAILQNDAEAYALGIRRTLEEATDRAVSRGALYRTLDRLSDKGLAAWSLDEPGERRGGHPLKRFEVTPDGLEALRRSREVMRRLSDGVEGLLEPSS